MLPRARALPAWLTLSLLPALAVAGPPAISDEVLDNARLRIERGYEVGMVIGLLGVEGVTYWCGGHATPGGAPLDESSVFEIGSITKVFTTITLARLVERGELSLEDRVADLLPEGVAMPQYGSEPIRLIDIATHRSGLPRMPSNFRPTVQLNPFADYTLEDLYEFLDGYEPPRAPRAGFEYSNLAMGLLGHLMELRTGLDYESLVRREILGPLGMTNTGIALTPTMRQRLALPHIGTSKTLNWDIPSLAGAGALRSSAVDMMRFLRANMGVTPSELTPAMRRTHEIRGVTAPNMSIGLGWVIREVEAGTIVWHNGGTGGYRTFAGFSPELGLGAVVLTNNQQSADDLGFRLLGATAEEQPLFDPVEKKRRPLFKKD